jgi:hypothetical protein
MPYESTCTQSCCWPNSKEERGLVRGPETELGLAKPAGPREKTEGEVQAGPRPTGLVGGHYGEREGGPAPDFGFSIGWPRM